MTQRPQTGLWTLTAPDGRMWAGDSPLQCCSAEQKERIPSDVAIERILKAAREEAVTAALLKKALSALDTAGAEIRAYLHERSAL